MNTVGVKHKGQQTTTKQCENFPGLQAGIISRQILMAAAAPACSDMLQLMEGVLSAPAKDRSPEMIQKILPFFRTRTPLFYNLSKGMSVSRITSRNE